MKNHKNITNFDNINEKKVDIFYLKLLQMYLFLTPHPHPFVSHWVRCCGTCIMFCKSDIFKGHSPTGPICEWVSEWVRDNFPPWYWLTQISGQNKTRLSLVDTLFAGGTSRWEITNLFSLVMYIKGIVSPWAISTYMMKWRS